MSINDASKTEAAFFDSLVGERGEFNPFAERGWKTLENRFSKWCTLSGPLDILDVGCGTGQSRRIYIKHARKYTGIDLSEGAISVARRKFPQSEWLIGNATSLPFPDSSFDVVAFSSVLHHIPDYRPAVDQAMRVLRPGGIVFAFDPNVLHPAMALFRWPKSPLYNSEGVSPNERPLLPGDLRRTFAGAGFADVQVRGQADLPYRVVAPKVLNACLTLYNNGDWLMARLGLHRFFGTFTLTFGRKPGRIVPSQTA